jgi:uncharacterized protein (TIRG00374 family)
MVSENKKRLLLALKILVAAGVIGLLAGSGRLDFGRVARGFRHGPGWIIMAAVCLLFGTCVTALRWHLLLKAQELHITYWNALRLTFIGIFFNTFMPGGTGGDLAKAYYVWDSGSKRAAAVTTVFLDRVVGLYAMLGLASVMALLQAKTLWSLPAAKPILICVPAGFLFGTAAIAVVFAPQIRRLLTAERKGPLNRVAQISNNVYESLLLYHDSKSTIFWALVLSFASHIALSLSFVAFGQTFGDPMIDIFTYFLIVPMGMIANGIPVLPMGIGQGEAAFHLLYEILADSPYGAEASISLRCLSIFWAAFGGLVYLTLKRSTVFKSEDTGEAQPSD